MSLGLSAVRSISREHGLNGNTQESGALPVRNRLPGALACVCIGLLTAAIYGQVVHHEFIDFDDDTYITANPVVQSGLSARGLHWAFTSFHAANWHPLTWISHMLDAQVFGLKPGGHHVTSVLIHTAAAMLLFLVLRSMTGAVWKSAAVAALFAVHPLHVESVTWVAERKDVLSAFFWVAATALYARYVSRPSAARYLAVVAAFVGGLLSKPMVVTLPFAFLLLDYWPLGRLRPVNCGEGQPRGLTRGALILEKVPLLVLAAASGAVTWFAQDRGGAMSPLDRFPLEPRLANAAISCVLYLKKMLRPAELSYLYPYRIHQVAEVAVIAAGLVLTAISLLALFAPRRRPWLAVGWSWYLLTLLPVIGIVQVGAQSMADRYTYLPSVGLFIALIWWLDHSSSRRPEMRVALAGAASSAIIILACIAEARADVWRDGISLFSQAVSVAPDNWRARNSLGTAYLRAGRIDAAREQYQAVVQLEPRYEQGHFNLGVSLQKLGNHQEALRSYSEAIRLRPGYARAHRNLGLVLYRLGRPGEGEAHTREATRIESEPVSRR